MSVNADRALLSVRDLKVSFPSPNGPVRAVDGVSFDVERGELVAVVGESGSGKSVTAAAVLRLLDESRATIAGAVRFHGRDLLHLDDRDMSRLRGAEVSIIFQDPLSALNPLITIGHQVRESLLIHGRATNASADETALRLLTQVEMPDPAAQFRQYPHELSGGMNQRAMIAIALACDPALLIADEPTTALDATTQIQIMDLIRGLARERDMAVLVITHDLGLVSDFADRVLIMYAGHLMEDATRAEFFDAPRNPYSRALLDATPRGRQALRIIPGSIPDLSSVPPGCVFHPRCDLRRGRSRCSEEAPALRRVSPLSDRRTACHYAEELDGGMGLPPASAELPHPALRAEPVDLLRVDGLAKDFTVKRRFLSRQHQLRAVDDISFTVAQGETLAIVGESGSGKSTTARLVLRLIEPTAGRVTFRGEDITAASGAALRRARRHFGMIFQDPDSSLDPYLTASAVVAEPLAIHGIGTKRERTERTAELLRSVGLKPERGAHSPRAFSGGERQRLAIARALALEPELIVCDEPTTMLDVSVQAQVLSVLKSIQADKGVSYLFIAHDLAVVRQISHRVAVMYAGRIIEACRTEDLFGSPHHPYSVTLIAASPDDPSERRPEAEQIATRLTIRPPDRSLGCPYATTCWKAEQVCREVVPPLVELTPGHAAACHFPENVPDDWVPSSTTVGTGVGR